MMSDVDSRRKVPGLTACGLCAGETLGEGDSRRDGQIGRLRDIAARGTATLTEVECLDQCNQGDVVVARPCADGRRRGASPVWFSGVAGDELTEMLEEWLSGGGPGHREVPEPLGEKVIDREQPAG
jgi:(2Fe-2S) ferredoxin